MPSPWMAVAPSTAPFPAYDLVGFGREQPPLPVPSVSLRRCSLCLSTCSPSRLLFVRRSRGKKTLARAPVPRRVSHTWVDPRGPSHHAKQGLATPPYQPSPNASLRWRPCCFPLLLLLDRVRKRFEI